MVRVVFGFPFYTKPLSVSRDCDCIEVHCEDEAYPCGVNNHCISTVQRMFVSLEGAF